VSVVDRGGRPVAGAFMADGPGTGRSSMAGPAAQEQLALDRTDARHQAVEFDEIGALVVEGLGGSRGVAAEALPVARVTQAPIDLGEPFLQFPSLLVQRRKVAGSRSSGQNDG
jgi:hypothetical protein